MNGPSTPTGAAQRRAAACRLLPGAVLVAALLACRAAAADTVVLPAPEQLIAVLRGTDSAQKEIAEGQLYLLPESAFPAFEAVLRQRGNQVPGPLEMALARALVLRGHMPAVRTAALAILRGGGDTYSYRLGAEQLLPFATAEELMPLAHELAAVLAAAKQPIAYQGNELWIVIAGRCGEPALLQQALALAASPQGRIARPAMAGRFDPDRCAATLLPAMAAGMPEDRLAYVRLLGRGWKAGPGRPLAALMRDPDAQIRRAFAMTLDASASDAALELAIHGIEDPDAMVRSCCLAALGSFHGTTQAALVRSIAIDAKADVNLRYQSWSMLSRLPGNLMEPEAKALVASASAERAMRDAAIAYLLQRQEAAWLLDAIPRLDAAAKAAVLSALARSGSVAVLSALPGFLRNAEPALVAEVMRSVASLKDPAVLPLLIGHLEDASAEVRSACLTALSSITGLTAHPHHGARGDATGQAEAAAAEIRAVHASWARWYDLFGPVPDPILDADLATASAALRARPAADRSPLPGLIGQAYPVLLRLSGDRNLGPRALELLASLGDPRMVKDVLALVDGPAYSLRLDEVALALMRSPADPGVLPQLTRMLAWPDDSRLAMQVLIAWRAPSPALTSAILERGTWDDNLLAELASWKDCPVLAAARRLITDAKADERQRSLALALLVAVGDEQDVTMLGQALQDGGSASTGAMRGLIRMASAGVESAAQALARFLNAASRKAPAKPGPPRAGEEPPPRLDLSPQVIAGLAAALQGGKAAAVVLPRPLLAAVGAWTRAATSLEDQCAGLALLIEANDAGAGELLHAMILASDATAAKRISDAILAIRHPEARACVDLLSAMPGLDDQIIYRIAAWYRDVVKPKEDEMARIMAGLQAGQDAQGGQPVRGLVLSMELPGSTAPLGAKGLKAKVTIRNAGKKAWSYFPEQCQFLLHIRCVEGPQGEFQRDVRFDFKSKMRPGGNTGTEPTVIEPGQSFSLRHGPLRGPGRGLRVIRPPHPPHLARTGLHRRERTRPGRDRLRRSVEGRRLHPGALGGHRSAQPRRRPLRRRRPSWRQTGAG